MDLGELQVFLTVAKEGSFSRAGERLYRTQPAISLGIRKLASKLFECRGNRDLRFIFQDRGAELFVSFLGSHDEIKTLLRRGSYR